MGSVVLVRTRLWGLLALAISAVFLLVACAELGSPTLRPTVSPLGTSRAPTNPPTPITTPRPTPTPWPAGWEEDFCAAFTELTVVHELVVDIPRAIDEDERDDALALARELRATAIATTELIEQLPSWERAEQAVAEMTRLADFGSRIGRQFVRHLDEGRRPALERAGELIDEMRPLAEEANATLADLASLGLSCPPHRLDLEVP